MDLFQELIVGNHNIPLLNIEREVTDNIFFLVNLNRYNFNFKKAS